MVSIINYDDLCLNLLDLSFLLSATDHFFDGDILGYCLRFLPVVVFQT